MRSPRRGPSARRPSIAGSHSPKPPRRLTPLPPERSTSACSGRLRMKRLITRAALAALAFTLVGAGNAAPRRAAHAAAPTTATIAPIRYVTRTLPNGLRVYAIRDPHAADVSVQVWYDVGSKDDPHGRSGFAHLFEHMMFKATRDLPAESFDRLTEDVGGFNNASTNDDFTNYYEVVPANHLERLLFARGRADELAGDRSRLLRVGARCGEGGAQEPRPRPALRAALLSLSPANLLRCASLCAAWDRQHRGSRRRDDRGRARLPRDLLPARQCGDGDRTAISTRPGSTSGSTATSARSRGPRPRSRG